MPKPETTLNFIPQKSIPNGTTFVAISGDGSGAGLFLITDHGELCDAEDGPMNITTPDTYLMDAGYLYWIELPDSFQLWFEKAYKELI